MLVWMLSKMLLWIPHWDGKWHLLAMVMTMSTCLLPLSAEKGIMKEYCQWETFQPRCGPGTVIMLNRARYGRMSYGKCIERDYGYVGCSNDVLLLMDARCSGRRSCDVRIPDEFLDATKPCPKDLIRYLAADWECIPVVEASASDCRNAHVTSAPGPSGLIASAVTEETGCGTTDRPWLIDARRGQRVNFTLYDFGIAKPNATHDRINPHCQVYIIIKELEIGKSKTICGGKDRVGNIYVTSSHHVEVRILQGASPRSKYFLLKYEVLGCPDIPQPEGGWLKKEGSTIEIGCAATSRGVKLVCNGTQWRGNPPNCTTVAVSQFIIGSVTLPYAMSMLIIVAVALMIGICILTVGLLVLKKQRRRAALARAQAATPVNKKMSNAYKDDPYGKVINNYDPPSLHPPNESPLENEYAYVEDFFPPPPPPAPPAIPLNKFDHMVGPGTNHIDFCKQRPIQSPRLADSCQECRDSRHYFELDPDMPTSHRNVNNVICGHHTQSQPLLSQFMDSTPYGTACFHVSRDDQGDV